MHIKIHAPDFVEIGVQVHIQKTREEAATKNEWNGYHKQCTLLKDNQTGGTHIISIQMWLCWYTPMHLKPFGFRLLVANSDEILYLTDKRVTKSKKWKKKIELKNSTLLLFYWDMNR